MRKYNLNIISEAPAPLEKDKLYILFSISRNTISFKYEQKQQLKLGLGVSLLVFVGSFIGLGKEISQFLWLPIIALGLSLIFAILLKFIPDKTWELNRMTQEITIPFILSKKPITSPVAEIKSGYYIQTGGKYATVPITVPVVWHNSRLPFCNASALTTWQDDEHNGADAARTWSFYIWYLDKNRPLPPGELLDPYREEDFQRRKAEGFPPPLFCSCIPTPEANSEQQAEREKYWKDEDYIFRLDRYREPSIWGGFKGKGGSALRMEKNAIILNKANNPDNWELKPYPEFENFKYLPTAFAMRYEYSDGSIYYSFINQKTEEVYTPPAGHEYRKEIIR